MGGDGNLLLLTARKRGDLAVVQVADADGLECLAHTLLDLVVGDAKVLQAKKHLVLDDRGDHLRVDVLQHAADDLRHIGERNFTGVVAVDSDRAKERAGVMVGYGSRQAGGKCGLTGARRTDNAIKSPLFTPSEMRASACSVSRAIGERDIVDVDDRFHGYLS